MTDARLMATNPEDSSLVPVACNAQGRLLTTMPDIIEGPPGQDGQDGKDGEDGKDGAPGADGKDGQDGKDGEPGKDGKDCVPEDQPVAQLLSFNHAFSENLPWPYLNGSPYENPPLDLDPWFRGMSNTWTPARSPVVAGNNVPAPLEPYGCGIYFVVNKTTLTNEIVPSLNFKLQNVGSCIFTVVFNVFNKYSGAKDFDFNITASFSGGGVYNQTPSEQLIQLESSVQKSQQFVVSGICIDRNVENLALNIAADADDPPTNAALYFQLASFVLTKARGPLKEVQSLDASGICPYKALPLMRPWSGSDEISVSS